LVVEEAIGAENTTTVDSTVALKVREAAPGFFDNYLQGSNVPWRDGRLAGQVNGTFSDHRVGPEVPESARI
jgi:hypothetical protein